MAVTPLAALHRKLFGETSGIKFATLKDRLNGKSGREPSSKNSLPPEAA